jgi:hypothetical protein
MFRNLALLVAATFLFGSGCREDTNPPPVDLSRPGGDMSGGGGGDMSVQQMMTSTTAHDIDTGSVATGTAVKMTGMISVAGVHRHLSKTSMYCEYRTMVSDANCNSPPCGVELYQRGIKVTTAGATTADCPYADAAGSMTVLGQIKNYGDVMDITGSVKSFSDTTPPMTVILHSVTVDTVTITTTKGPLPTPIAITDTNPSTFVAHSGSAWSMYEGTYIKLSPMSGQFTTSALDSFSNFTLSPGNAEVDTNNYYGPKDAGMWPPQGSLLNSISGVVWNDFGGSISPILPSDYNPLP